MQQSMAGRDLDFHCINSSGQMASLNHMATTGDGVAIVPFNMTLSGDVTITVNHARQALGSLKPVKI